MCRISVLHINILLHSHFLLLYILIFPLFSSYFNLGSLRAVLNDEGIELNLIKKLSICLDVADG